MSNENITIEGARIAFRNFAGTPDKFNPKGGDRSFCVMLDKDIAEDLIADGWNVRYLKPRDDEDEPQAYLKVKVVYGKRPPKIYIVTRKQKTLLTDKTVDSLDYAEIANVDIVIRPYDWEVGGKTGRAAYVTNMYVTVIEDAFAAKYDFDDED